AISFSIISVLTGAILLFGYGLKLAGPIVNSVGWPVVSVFTLAVAASMAELASAYPTAGGLFRAAAERARALDDDRRRHRPAALLAAGRPPPLHGSGAGRRTRAPSRRGGPRRRSGLTTRHVTVP